MDFALNDEQRAFRDAVAAFARDRLAGDYAGADRRGSFREGLVGEMAELGLVGLRIPQEHGGQGADALSAGIAVEEVARADLNASYLVFLPALVAEVLVGAADERQRERWLPAIAAGETLPCFCLTEPEHGSDAARLGLRAERDGTGWRLTGEKTSISLGMSAHTALVFARTGGEGARGISAFYVELDDRFVAALSLRGPRRARDRPGLAGVRRPPRRRGRAWLAAKARGSCAACRASTTRAR